MSQTLELKAYDYVRSKIRSGALRPGSVVSETLLAREMGMSRTPVRHAIRQLHSEGCIGQVAGYGTVVPTLKRDDVDEVWDIRVALESLAAGRAASRITPGQVAALERLLAQMRAITPTVQRRGKRAWYGGLCKEYESADERFHELIVAASGSSRLVQTVKNLRLIGSLVFVSMDTPFNDVVKRLPEIDAEHAAVFEALRHRDGKLAARQMRRHLKIGKHIHLLEVDAAASMPAAPAP